jgi:hypothetical protein
MRTDARWSAWYDDARAAGRGDAPLGDKQADLVEAMLFAELPRETPPTRVWLKAGVPTAACAALALVFLVPTSSEPTAFGVVDGWTARGSADTAPRIGVRARCYSSDAQRALDDAEVGPRQVEDTLSCPLGGLVGFSLTNLAASPHDVFVIGLARDGSLRWLPPFEEASASVRMVPGDVDRSLDVVANTAVLPAGEDITLHVVFSDHPLRGAELGQALRAAALRGTPLKDLRQLPGVGDAQARIHLVRVQ